MDALLARRTAQSDLSFRPRSLAAAAQLLPEAQWVLISTPGRYAAGVARDALALGKHVFLYSDNVPVDEEIRLKHAAADKGLLVMGPDCGTAIINGVGLGFANQVRARGHRVGRRLGHGAAAGHLPDSPAGRRREPRAGRPAGVISRRRWAPSRRARRWICWRAIP